VRTAPRRAPFALLVAGLLGAGLAALLTLNTIAAADEVEARRLSTASSANQDQITQLQIDISAKQAPGVLASKAAALGMVPDPNPVFLSIAANGTVTILGSAQKVPVVVTPAPTPIPTPTPTPAPTPALTATPTPTAAGTGTPPTPAPTPAPTPVASSTLPGGVR
jgi:hypothetical protein